MSVREAVQESRVVSSASPSCSNGLMGAAPGLGIQRACCINTWDTVLESSPLRSHGLLPFSL